MISIYNREIKLGDSVDDQQVGCLWQGKNVLTVSLSGKINYINVESGGENVVKTLKGHNKSITAVAVANQNTANPIIFSGSHDGLIIKWNANTGEMDSLSTAESINQHSNQVNAMSFDSVTNTLVTCGLDDTLKFIDTQRSVYM